MDFFLGTPEHNHAITNHLPLVGLAASTIPLFLGLVLRHPAIIRTGLLVALLFGLTTGFVMGTGEEAKERFEARDVPHVELTPSDFEILERHDEQAHLAGKVAYVATAVAGLGLIISFTRRSWSTYVALGATAAILVAIVLLAIAAKSGGQIRHPEFRSSLPANDSASPQHADEATPEAPN